MSGPALSPRRHRRPPPRSRRRRPAIVLAAIAAAAAALAIALSGGDSEEEARGPAGGDRLESLTAGLIDEWAERWPKVQRDDGHYRSQVGGGTRYGEAMLGWAMLRAGLRTDDERLVDSALKAFAYTIRRTHLHSRASAFENLALAGAYNVASRGLRGDPRFERLRPRWEEFLRGVMVDRLAATTYYGNHWLVEAWMVQEILRSGLRSDERFAILGGYRDEADRLSRELINERIPAMARERGRSARGRRTLVLSDPPEDPLAYHGLSLGMYARTIELLGPRAEPAARRTLRQVANASLAIAAPDGDLGYAGRNQEQVWSLAATAYGSSVAAAVRGSRPPDDAAYRGLARRALERLRSEYGVGQFGVNITPAVKKGRRSGERGVDKGAGGASFGGIAQLFLEQSLPWLERLRDRPVGPIPADAGGGAIVGEGEGSMAVVRSGRVWFAVRRSPSGKSPHDVRYDFGLVAMKVRGDDGSWRDALRLRPLLLGRPDSAGPILRTPQGPGIPYGERIALARDGTVTVSAGFRGTPTVQKLVVAHLPWGTIVRGQDASPGPLHRAGGAFTFRPVGCGVEMTFPARAGDRFEQSAFFVERPRVGPTELADAASRVTLSRPAATRLEEGHASGTDNTLVRARMSLTAPSGGPVRVRFCDARGGPG